MIAFAIIFAALMGCATASSLVTQTNFGPGKLVFVWFLAMATFIPTYAIFTILGVI